MNAIHLFFYTVRNEVKRASWYASLITFLSLLLASTLHPSITQTKSWILTIMECAGLWLIVWPFCLAQQLAKTQQYRWLSQAIHSVYIALAGVRFTVTFFREPTLVGGITLFVLVPAVGIFIQSAIIAWKNRPLSERVPKS